MAVAGQRVGTIDAHVGGAAVRLVVDGFPAPRGRTMSERVTWAERHADHLRQALLREPRGHLDLTGALLVEPVSPAAEAGLLVMSQDGFGGFRGHDLVAAVTIALERGLLVPRAPESFVVDTVAGPVEVRPARRAARDGAARVTAVTYTPPPCAVAGASIPVEVSGRLVRADVAWAAGWYAVVDREALGVPSESQALEIVRHAALAAVDALDVLARRWPVPGGGTAPMAGVVLTAPPAREDADLRSTTVYSDGTIDRSPSGCGTCAVLAVLDAMGLVGPDRPVRHEGPSGQVFEGRVVDRLSASDPPAIVAEITATAWITGEHVFLLDAEDPLADGFRL
jgi:proline racemase